jgi:Histidine kinase
MPDPATLVRELNHRVKNNLQIIVSLMNLQKRITAPDRREDLRFIEEHVQSMSVAYRLVYATGSMVDVSLTELVTEVLSGLRQIAGLEEERLSFAAPATDALIGLDHAIALALYLAVLLPHYLDQAIVQPGSVTISVTVVANLLTLSVGGSWNAPVGLDVLRNRLMRAYAAQLKAEMLPATIYGAEQLRFMLERANATSPA